MATAWNLHYQLLGIVQRGEMRTSLRMPVPFPVTAPDSSLDATHHWRTLRQLQRDSLPSRE